MRRSGTNTETSCEHFIGIDESKVSPKTPTCEECEKEGTDWVALFVNRYFVPI